MELYLPALLVSYARHTPTNRPTDQPTDGHEGYYKDVTLPIMQPFIAVTHSFLVDDR